MNNRQNSYKKEYIHMNRISAKIEEYNVINYR